MTNDEIKFRLECIEREANNGDFEAAHDIEDALAWAFIEWVASDSNQTVLMEAANKAKLVLSSKNINFDRYSR